jgi:hypothetical protein
MILSLGQGEPSYVPDGLMGQARDSADISYVAFLQCYARDLVKWEMICYFAGHQDEWSSLSDVADAIDHPESEVAQHADELVSRHLLDERVMFTGVEYALTCTPHLRHQAARLGSEWRCLAQQTR